MAGNFNEDACSKMVQEIMIEVGLHGFLAEAHSIEKHQRGASLEHGSKRANLDLEMDRMVVR